MRHKLKHAARRFLDGAGAYELPRRLLPQWPRILMYHRFSAPGVWHDEGTSADVFRQQLQHIKQHYQPMHLRELIQAWVSGKPIDGSVALTVDDGHADFLEWAMPLLEEFGVPATLFVVSALPDGDAWLWTDRLSFICEAAAAPVFSSPHAQRAASQAFKQMPPEAREQRLSALARQSGVEFPAVPPPAYKLLTWDNLQRLVASPLIDIGSHTRTHPILSTIDKARAWEEIEGSRRDLERRLDIAITTFCYPNGSFGDYRAEHVAMAAEAGYCGATAAHFGCVRPSTDRFALPRIACHAGDLARFRKAVDGFEELLRRWRGERCW